MKTLLIAGMIAATTCSVSAQTPSPPTEMEFQIGMIVTTATKACIARSHDNLRPCLIYYLETMPMRIQMDFPIEIALPLMIDAVDNENRKRLERRK